MGTDLWYYLMYSESVRRIWRGECPVKDTRRRRICSKIKRCRNARVAEATEQSEGQLANRQIANTKRTGKTRRSCDAD